MQWVARLAADPGVVSSNSSSAALLFMEIDSEIIYTVIKIDTCI